MRTQFVQGSRRYAAKECPWACRLAKVANGYMCFESETDYQTWKRQK
jgi:hypothetical protein